MDVDFELLLTLTHCGSEQQSTWHAPQGEEPVLRESEKKIEGIYFTEKYIKTIEKCSCVNYAWEERVAL